MLITSYNRLFEFHDYWSSKRSLGNDLIREVILRDRFCLVFSKLYFASPKNPEDASKIYYIEDFANCLRRKFIQNFEDFSLQSIDESIAKFKGRSSLKQYMPFKPVKRGIKLWMRSCSRTGCVYDFSIYQGKNENETKTGLLGERVVSKLLSSVKKKILPKSTLQRIVFSHRFA